MADVWLDVDGVLADFCGRMAELHGVSLEELYASPESKGVKMDDLMGVTPEEFWAPARGVDFWVGLDKTPEADEMMDLVVSRFGMENVNFLTTSSRDHDSLKGKGIWLEKNYPEMSRRFLAGGAKKYHVAYPGAILFDDMESNVDEFSEKGGTGILIPRIWNRGHELEPHLISYLTLLTA